MNLVRFVDKKRQDKDADFFAKPCNDKICAFFAANNDPSAYSEILKIAKYYFAIPGHNANCERAFSLIKSQWTDERNRMSVQTARALVTIKTNFKNFTCVEFHKYLLRPENVNLLRSIGDSKKY